MVSGSDDLAASPGSTAAKAQPAVLFAWGLAAYLVVKLIFLAVLGLNSQYLMDEFDTISHMRFLDGVPYRDSWPPRTLLNVLFYWPAFEFWGDSVSVMRARPKHR